LSPRNELSATKIAEKSRPAKPRARAVVRDCLTRIAARDGVVKASVNFDAEYALDQARDKIGAPVMVGCRL